MAHAKNPTFLTAILLFFTSLISVANTIFRWMSGKDLYLTQSYFPFVSRFYELLITPSAANIFSFLSDFLMWLGLFIGIWALATTNEIGGFSDGK